MIKEKTSTNILLSRFVGKRSRIFMTKKKKKKKKKENGAGIGISYVEKH